VTDEICSTIRECLGSKLQKWDADEQVNMQTQAGVKQVEKTRGCFDFATGGEDMLIQ
jgi:hypothetical protein